MAQAVVLEIRPVGVLIVGDAYPSSCIVVGVYLAYARLSGLTGGGANQSALGIVRVGCDPLRPIRIAVAERERFPIRTVFRCG